MQESYQINGIDFAKYNPEIDWSGKYFDSYSEVANIKNRAGVYAFTLCNEIVYVGSSTNLFGRLQTHIAHINSKTNRTSKSVERKKYYYLKKYISHVKFKVLDVYPDNISKEQLETYEYEYICKYNPIFNIKLKDSIQIWCGTEQNIEDFVKGLLTIDDLTKMKFKGEQL